MHSSYLCYTCCKALRSHTQVGVCTSVYLGKIPLKRCWNTHANSLAFLSGQRIEHQEVRVSAQILSPHNDPLSIPPWRALSSDSCPTLSQILATVLCSPGELKASRLGLLVNRGSWWFALVNTIFSILRSVTTGVSKGIVCNTMENCLSKLQQ